MKHHSRSHRSEYEYFFKQAEAHPDPNCSGECELTRGTSLMTSVYAPTLEDKSINTEINIFTSRISCTTCGRAWQAHTQNDTTDFTEVIE
jgi:hypothetical protein